jgi:hypothetical protein
VGTEEKAGARRGRGDRRRGRRRGEQPTDACMQRALSVRFYLEIGTGAFYSEKRVALVRAALCCAMCNSITWGATLFPVFVQAKNQTPPTF